MKLENEVFRIEINSKGAELKSAFHKILQKELIYNGNTAFWNRSSPILFPIVGRLKNNTYQLKNQTFQLNQHGFARDQKFNLIEKNENKLLFSFISTEETQQLFPFVFELQVAYILEDNKLTTAYKVINLGKEDLPFSIGAHPGFYCPINENERFEDYYLEFEKEEDFTRHLLNCETGLFTGETEIVISKKNCIDLNYSYFLKDAIVFKNLNSSWINLKSKKSNFCLKFSIEDFPFFGIWTKEKAPFICLEPWCGVADSENSNGKFLQKEGINILSKNQVFERKFSFEV